MKTAEEIEVLAKEKFPRGTIDYIIKRNAFTEGYTACQDEDRWVPVSERKEIKGGYYLVVDTNSLPNQRRYALAFYRNHNGIWVEENGDIIHPTHYKPLPNPPKK